MIQSFSKEPVAYYTLAETVRYFRSLRSINQFVWLSTNILKKFRRIIIGCSSAVFLLHFLKNIVMSAHKDVREMMVKSGYSTAFADV